jgi:hypothetical protein
VVWVAEEDASHKGHRKDKREGKGWGGEEEKGEGSYQVADLKEENIEKQEGVKG